MCSNQMPNAPKVNRGVFIQNINQRKVDNTLREFCGSLTMGQLHSIVHGERSARQLITGPIGSNKLSQG